MLYEIESNQHYEDDDVMCNSFVHSFQHFFKDEARMKILFKHDSGGFAILITKQQLTIMKKVVFLKRSSIHSQSFIQAVLLL